MPDKISFTKRTAIIIGAGPAGLTAAYELLKRTDIIPLIFEASETVGGIAKTINYKGNRMDIGPHRFFSKSNRVMEWWFSILPLQIDKDLKREIKSCIFKNISEKNLCFSEDVEALDEEINKTMLVKNRYTRILFRNKLFEYPLKLNYTTFQKLGYITIIHMGFSYIYAKIFPIKKEKSLEDFFTNRFGQKLYQTFFKDYTEKVWGLSCDKINPDWGVQRVKGLSITKVIKHALKNIIHISNEIDQKKNETSLIEYFFYPKYGSGQMWDEVACRIRSMGGKIYLNHKVFGINQKDKKISNIKVIEKSTGITKTMSSDYYLSTMPIRDLIASMQEEVPSEIYNTANKLCYRDLIVIGLLFSRLDNKEANLPDNWIYIQENSVKIGRLQIYNNWSSKLVKHPNAIWLGLEYFCQEGDELWNKGEDELISLGVKELEIMGFVKKESFMDGKVIKTQKAYPAYFGGYESFHLIRNYLDTFENLFLIGRNGMHKYNNVDHSMLAAMTAVDNIVQGITSKENLWKVNTETEYHEEKKYE